MADAVLKDADATPFVGRRSHRHRLHTGGRGVPPCAVVIDSANSRHPASRNRKTVVTGKPNWMLTSKTDDRPTARLLANSYGPKTGDTEAEMDVVVSRMGRMGLALAGNARRIPRSTTSASST